MATEHICDRCKQRIPKPEFKAQIVQVRFSTKAGSPFQWEHIWHDLCPKCVNDFLKWYGKSQKLQG